VSGVGMDLPNLLKDTAALAECLDQTELQVGLGALRDRYLAQEWVLILLGETSSGKSTWINSLLGAAILPTAPGSTTSQVVEIRFHDQAEPRYERLDAKGAMEVVDIPTFQRLCIGSAGQWRLRLWWPISWIPAALDLDTEIIRGLVLFDTPGYNACLNEHFDLLAKVLPEADAVLGMLNFDRGLTPQDVDFLKLVKVQLGPEADTLMLLAVNRVPASGGDRRRAEMQARLKTETCLEAPLHTLPRYQGEQRVQCWNRNLWKLLEQLASSPARSELQVANADQADLERFSNSIQRQRGLLVQAEGILREGREAMIASASRTLLEGRAVLWGEIEGSISEAGRLTESGECAGFVNHLINHGLQRTTLEAERGLVACHDQFVKRLDHLLLEVGSMPTPKAVLDGPSMIPLRNYMARRGLQEATEGLFFVYLRKLGGRGREKAGIVNLGKKVVSKFGDFPRPIYDSMGGLMKRLGITASKAATVVGVIVIELASYLYGVFRWKQSLKGMVQLELGLPVLDEPIEHLVFRKLKFWSPEKKPAFVLMQEEWTASITETMDQTTEVVRDNFTRRVEVLEAALLSRRDSETMAQAQEQAGVLETLLTRFTALQGECL